jgi:flagellar P-ring protein precursor FlgI
MNIMKKSLFVAFCFIWFASSSLSAQTKIRDLTKVYGANDRVLIGYGLVTGLDRTGDRTIRRQGAAFTVQSIANMLQNFGVNVDPDLMRTRNVAAVMVTARLTPYNAQGSMVDVTVSSLGDATSLVGGVLLQTPLIDPEDKDYYVKAQGPLIVGGITAEIPGARVSQNQTLTGSVPNGGIVMSNGSFQLDKSQPLGLILSNPSYANADRIAEVINQTYSAPLANVHNAGLIYVSWPAQLTELSELNRFVSQVFDLEIETDAPARVVINERTGTIVAGGTVRIAEVLVSHGNIQIATQQTPFVSQPAPLSIGGQTISGNISSASITEGPNKTFVLEPNTNVTSLAAALNTLGLSPRDIVAIFQAIHQAGALKGELVIM